MPQELSNSQRALVEAEGAVFALACPGAGKTRAMVERFLRRTAEEPRRGVALVSFTNVAVDEVLRRCAGRDDAVRAPHFVGTFDAFIHRFIVTPLFSATYGVHPRYVQSWKDVHQASFRLAGVTGGNPSVELSWFSFNPDGSALLDTDRLPNLAPAFRNVLLTRRSGAEQRAGQEYARLLRRGTVTCDAARLLAMHWIAEPQTRQTLGQLVGTRFSEIIVDEAQDCGEEELSVLAFLQEVGVNLVMLGDPDQSIFEFRRALPEKVRAFGATLMDPPLELRDNYRSSPAVCSFNNALRSGDLVERSSGASRSNETPVQLISYSRLDEVGQRVVDVAEVHGIAAEELMIVSHKASHSIEAAGLVDVASLPANRVIAVADAGLKLRSASVSPRVRLDAIRRVETAVIRALVDDDMKNRSIEKVCEDLGLDPRRLREIVVRLVLAHDAATLDAGTFAANVRQYLADTDWGRVKPPASWGSTFKAPKATDWQKLNLSSARPLVPFSTIHGVKGMEFRGTALIVPQRLIKNKTTNRTVLDDWEAGQDSEARRVLYVAGSRAEELLVIAAHRSHAERIAGLLQRDGVPFERPQ